MKPCRFDDSKPRRQTGGQRRLVRRIRDIFTRRRVFRHVALEEEREIRTVVTSFEAQSHIRSRVEIDRSSDRTNQR